MNVPQAQPASNALASSYKQLARRVARTFYAGPCPPASYRDADDVEGARSKLGKVDTTGLGIILMDYLLHREWVGEESIVTDVKVHHKLIRRALKYLEKEQLLMSEHRRETMRSQKKDVVRAVMGANAEAARDPADIADEEEAAAAAAALHRGHLISYYAVDFPRMFDAVQLRLHHMKKRLKDELEAKEVLAKYVCSASWCAKEHDSLGIHWLVKEDGELHCDMCDSLVLRVLASGQTGDDLARRERRKMIASRLERIESQLRELVQAVSALRNSNPPFYGTLRDWAIQQQALQAQQAQMGARAGGAGGRGGGGGAGGAGGLPGVLNQVAASSNYWQDTQVEVSLAGGTGAAPAAAAGPSGAGGAAAGAGESKAGAGGGSAAIPWLRAGGAAAAAATGPSVEDKAAAARVEAEEEARQKAYVAAYMQALMAQEEQQKRAREQGLAAPPAKRAKQEEGPPQQGDAADNAIDVELDVHVPPQPQQPAQAQQAPAPELPAASPAPGAGDEDEWEDV